MHEPRQSTDLPIEVRPQARQLRVEPVKLRCEAVTGGRADPVGNGGLGVRPESVGEVLRQVPQSCFDAAPGGRADPVGNGGLGVRPESVGEVLRQVPQSCFDAAPGGRADPVRDGPVPVLDTDPLLQAVLVGADPQALAQPAHAPQGLPGVVRAGVDLCAVHHSVVEHGDLIDRREPPQRRGRDLAHVPAEVHRGGIGALVVLFQIDDGHEDAGQTLRRHALAVAVFIRREQLVAREPVSKRNRATEHANGPGIIGWPARGSQVCVFERISETSRFRGAAVPCLRPKLRSSTPVVRR